ncbi:MAG: helix-turn-helix domain-containing protein [Pirellulaceae bacterium]
MATPSFRGGNSRQLGRLLDAFLKPLAILNRQGEITYANAKLCEFAGADPTQLVGKQAVWELPEDELPFGKLLSLIAPPAAAREGDLALRQFAQPLTFHASLTGQLFIPIVDEEGTPEFTIVLLDDWNVLQRQIKSTRNENRRPDRERVIAETRERWDHLSHLHVLLGESPEIQLAMRRCQLAVTSPSRIWIEGPRFIGKNSVSKAIFAGRLKSVGLSGVAGQYFTIDCSVLDANLIEGMLEVFAGRLRSGADPKTQLLVLDRFESLPSPAVSPISNWLSDYGQSCTLATLSENPRAALNAAGGSALNQLIHQCCDIEISLPGLAQRREDIGGLVHHYLAVHCKAANRALLSVAPDALALLEAYPWRENLRELEATIRSAVELAVLTKTIQISHLPVEVRTFAGTGLQETSPEVESISLDEVLEEVEKIVLRRAMRLSPRNRAQVARWLGISRPRLLRRISQLGLDGTVRPTAEDDDS